MTPPAAGPARRRRALLLAPVLLALAVLGLLLVRPAGAATGTVTLTSSGPSPQTVTISRGDTVRFVNSDNSDHTITSNAGAWSFRATIRPGASATTSRFGASGQFGYNDAFFVTVVQRNVDGFISVRPSGATATPKPTASKSPSPRPTASPTASPSASPRPTHSPTASPSASPSGIAFGPGMGGLPSLTLGPSGPAPNVAGTESAAATPTFVAYGSKSEIVQTSAHKYGLPVMLALLAAVGVLSLLVRLLLAEPVGEEAGASLRRTGEEGPSVEA